ncbi:MAG: energy transducer TonB [Flavobacteriales bacterium]|nr:energy transducer TonB [Flavobacteriales bacterium]
MKLRHLLPCIALLAMPMATRAQYIYGANAVFPGDTSRTEVAGALVYVDVERPCSLMIAITVDRAGNVLSAEVDRKVSTCVDKDVQDKAVQAVRERKFNTVKSPATQRGTVLWQYREPERDLYISMEGDPQPTPTDPNEPLVIVEEMPEFPGGNDAMMKYLSAQIKYPEEAVENGIGGTVYVSYVVERDGRLSEVKVLRGIGGGCDEEALRVMKSMPNWIPGKQNGKVVRVRYNLPFRFHL